MFEGEVVTVTARVSARGETSTALDVAALNPDGEPCALGTAALDRGPRAAPPDPAAYPAASLPAERLPATRERLAALAALGSLQLTLDEAAARAYLDETDEPLPLYRGPGAPAHPALFLHQANRALDRNVLMGPWIHASSEIRHLSLWRVGEPLATRGRVRALWEKNDREYVELDLLMVAGDTRPVAHVQHRCIYRIGPR